MKKFFVLGALVCTLAGAASAAPDGAVSAYDTASEATLQALDGKQWAQAETLAKQALGLASTSEQKYRQRVRLASINVELGRVSEARQWLVQVEQIMSQALDSTVFSDDDKIRSLGVLADIYKQLGEPDQAQALLQRGLQFERAASSMRAMLGLNSAQIYEQQERFGEANAALDAAFEAAAQEDKGANDELKKNLPVILRMSRASLLNGEKKFDESRAQYRAILDTPELNEAFGNAMFSTARMNIAVSYKNQGQSEQAIAAYSAIIADESVAIGTRALAQKTVGDVYKEQQSKWPEARAAYQKSLDLVEQAAQNDPDFRKNQRDVYAGILQTYAKEFDDKRARAEAATLFAPLSEKMMRLRDAKDYEAALPLYLAAQGFHGYLPGLTDMKLRIEVGEMMMFNGYFEKARGGFAYIKTVRFFVAKEENLTTEEVTKTFTKNYQALELDMARSYKLEAAARGNMTLYPKARALYEKLLATPSLDPNVRASAEADLKELDVLDP